MNKKILLVTITVSLLLAGCGKTGPTNTAQQPKEQSTSAATTRSDLIDYNQYVKKTWIKNTNTNNNHENRVSYSISKIENGKITGELTVVGPAPANPSDAADLNGTINKDTAECQFTDSRGNNGNIKLVLKQNDEMEATIDLTAKSQDVTAQPPEGTFQFKPYNLKDIKGFSPIENQSFRVNLNSWGNVKFVSGKLTAGNHIPVVFYLTNEDGDILYDFNAALPYSVDVKAVSFEDVNKDGLKDIIIIAAADDGYGPRAAVYLQKANGSFTNDPKLDQELNDSGNNKDVKTITSYLSQKF